MELSVAVEHLLEENPRLWCVFVVDSPWKLLCNSYYFYFKRERPHNALLNRKVHPWLMYLTPLLEACKL